jgi:hypothetical protein
MLGPVDQNETHVYLITSSSHEFVQRFRVGSTKKTLVDFKAECEPYMCDVLVYRFSKISAIKETACLDSIAEALKEFRVDTNSGWYEGKKDVIQEAFDKVIAELYQGNDDQFIVDLLSLSQAVARSADPLELRIKLKRLAETGHKWLKTDI